MLQLMMSFSCVFFYKATMLKLRMIIDYSSNACDKELPKHLFSYIIECVVNLSNQMWFG